MMLKRSLSVLALFMMTVLLFAQGTPVLELSISESKVNMTAEEISGEEPVSYRPGDVIRYEILAENSGDGVMTNPVITDPIPAGVVYLPLTAKGEDARITFSIDKGNSYQNWPPTYVEKDERGRNVKKTATPEMITHIRWEIRKALAPEDKRILAFDVEVK